MRYKGILIGLLVFAALLFIYSNYIAGTENDPLLTSTSESSDQGALLGQEIVEILEEIQSIEIDTSFFENSAFTQLIDYRTQVEPEPVGRRNPFEEIGFGVNIDDNIAEPLPPVLQYINVDSSESNIEPDEDGSDS